MENIQLTRMEWDDMDIVVSGLAGPQLSAKYIGIASHGR